MTAAAILKEKGDSVVTVKDDQTLMEVCGLLRGHGIGAVVVLDAMGKVSGILSERDIVCAVARAGREMLDRTAGAVMSRDIVTCEPGERVSAIMEKMTERRFRHVPVMDRGRLVGIISIGDVVKRRIADAEYDVQAMREYIATG